MQERRAPFSRGEGGELRPRRPIFLQGGRPVKPTIWQLARVRFIGMRKYARALFFILGWEIIFGALFWRHYIAVALTAIALGIACVVAWDARQAKRELARMKENVDFLEWFDRFNALSRQYSGIGAGSFPTPTLRQYFREGKTVQEVFELVKPGMLQRAAKITRINSGLEQ